MSANFFVYRFLRCIAVVPFLLMVGCDAESSQDGQEKQPSQRLGTSIQQVSLPNRLLAWCIVPFDSVERTPVQRLDMLDNLGIHAYAYDWREKHLPEAANEFQLAQSRGIEVDAVWMWIDANQDAAGRLSENNQKILDAIEEAGLQTHIWLGFHANFFEGLSDEAKLARGVEMVEYVWSLADALGCKVALYNHGDWMGEPENQIRIIESLIGMDLGMVYNFHHGHHHIDRFAEMVDDMLPYLWCVNLNGMKKDGPKIMPLGEGDHEWDMLNTLLDAGYRGPLGIIGHVEEADVAVILQQNLEGLSQYASQRI